MPRTEVVMPKGINRDLSPFELPLETWSDGNNINFRRIRTNSTLGYSNPFSLPSTVVDPTYLQYFADTANQYWLYCGDNGVGTSDVYYTDGVVTNLLGTGFGATRNATWTGADFNSLLVINNRNDQPQVLPAPYNTLYPMPNWGSTAPGTQWGAASRCEVMRGYKNYLVAMDCYNDTGTRYNNMVRWSGPAQLGDVPDNWDPDLIGSQAGLYNLADTGGRVVDGLTLGDYFIIYKTDSVWLMQFIGGDFTMKFRKLFSSDAGALGKDCVAEYQGKHFVLGNSGAYVHNASSQEEIMDNWVKDELFLNVNPDYLHDTKVIADHNNSEIWIYYISKNAEDGPHGPYADKALIWNWDEAKWTKRDLTGISYIAEGFIEPNELGVDTWDGDTQSWNADTTRWTSDIAFNASLPALLLADNENDRFYANEYAQGIDQYFPSSWVQRIGIDLDDDRTFKHLSRVVPHINSQNPVKVTVYMSDIQTNNPTIAATAVFDPLKDEDIDCHAVGRYMGIKFESDRIFTINGYTLEWDPVGQF